MAALRSGERHCDSDAHQEHQGGSWGLGMRRAEEVQSASAHSSGKGSFLSLIQSTEKRGRYFASTRPEALLAVPDGRAGGCDADGIANVSEEETLGPLTLLRPHAPV